MFLKLRYWRKLRYSGDLGGSDEQSCECKVLPNPHFLILGFVYLILPHEKLNLTYTMPAARMQVAGCVEKRDRHRAGEISGGFIDSCIANERLQTDTPEKPGFALVRWQCNGQ